VPSLRDTRIIYRSEAII